MGRHFSQAQRNEVINLHINENYSTRYLAKEFNIARSTIQNWLQAYRLEHCLEPVANNRKGKNQKSFDPSKIMMIKKIKVQIEVLEAFQNELERWDQLD